MPINPTYPGIYVQELPSTVHPITGVSTSVTAFVDFFTRGPTDKAVQINSYSDFGRIFGGLDARSEASYAIQQFFLNGGTTAWVIRIADVDSKFASTILNDSYGTPVLKVQTISPGAWSNGNVWVGVDWNRVVNSASFNLVVRETSLVNGNTQVVSTEIYRNLNMTKGDPNNAISVVNDQSSLVFLIDKTLGPDEVPYPIKLVNGVNEPASTYTATSIDVINASLLNPQQNNNFQPLARGLDGSLFTSAGELQEGGAGAFMQALLGDQTTRTGMYALDNIEPFIFNILCIPAAALLYAFDNGQPGNYTALYSQAEQYCATKRAFLMVDIPPEIDTTAQMADESAFLGILDSLRTAYCAYAAVYFPRINVPDPLNQGRPRNTSTSGTLAGIYSQTDSQRGVWKAPAGTATGLVNASLVTTLTDADSGTLNPLGINTLRNFPLYGTLSWGARTLDGADELASQWKYIPVRRTANFIEESLYEGLKWVVFEPNAAPLWAQIRLNVGAFMQNLFRQGAFQGQTRDAAYFVKCDNDTTTQNDIDLGVVNIVVGFAPLLPAEFVVIQIQQMAGQIQV